MKNADAKRGARWKSFLGNSALLFGSLALTVALAEVAVRIAMPQQLTLIRPDLWAPVDTVGWVRRPNVNARINTGEGAVSLITDREGFRIGAQGRSEGMPVLLLGDSFVEALQVEHEQSLAGRLETSLTSAVGEPVAIRNAGVSGWAPGQYLARARTLVTHGDYDLVIVAIYVGNDAKPLRLDYTPPRQAVTRHPFRVPRALSKAELLNAVLHPVNETLEVRSHLYVLLRRKAETLRKKAGLSANYFPIEFLKSEGVGERWSVTAQVCSDIAELANQHGAHTLFVLIPTDFQVDAEKFNQYVRGFGIDTADVALDQPSERLMEELTGRGLVVIDALQEFRRRHAAGESLYGLVDQHLSAGGHQALADLVTPVAKELLAGPR